MEYFNKEQQEKIDIRDEFWSTKVRVNENNEIELVNLFNGVKIISTDGEELFVCLRDGGFELKYDDKSFMFKGVGK